MWRFGTLMCGWLDIKWGSCYGNSMEGLKNLKTELSYDLAMPLLSIHPKECKGLKQILIHLLFKAASCRIAKKWKPLICPSTYKRINKMWSIYTLEYESALKRMEVLIQAKMWMNPEEAVLSEVSQT